uniref:Gustatory receptor n=1 Tax=Panagrolaimus davidi TaxID=227884 RepID=A0A914QU33_9BILA
MGIAIEKGEIQCNAPGQNASYDSIVSCILFQLPFKLESIGFGYICLALLIPIILISIFGKIKEQYRWFILNQAIWDLLITYDFICEKPTYYYFRTQYVVFNLVFLLLSSSYHIYNHIIDDKKRKIEADDAFRLCYTRNCPRDPVTYIPQCNQTLIDECLANRPIVDSTLSNIFLLLKFPLSIIFLVASIIFAILMTAKVGKQLKFQIEHNQASLQTTLRISAVCLFQCFTMTFMLLLILLESINDLNNIIQDRKLFDILTSFPSWADLLRQDFTVQSFNVIRVFLDAFIVLVVLNGYRQNCKYFGIFVLKLFKNPMNAFNSNSAAPVTKSKVTTISINKSK